MNHAKLRLSLAVTLALASSPLLALGLGQIEVKSKLSEPLVAEIPIVSSSAEELDSMAVKLASPDAFARVGLDRPNFLAANLEFSVGRNGRGENVIRVTTNSKVDDPYLSFLIEADWGSGKLVREFSVLLDPPYLAPAPRAQVRTATVAPAGPTAAPSQAVPAASADIISAPLAAAGAPFAGAAQRYAGQVSGDRFGPIASGQTLSQIADSLRPGDVGLNQMMVALLRANPEAFIDGNVNQLKRGAILRIPGASELSALSAAEAAAIVREQTESWQQAREPQLQPVENAAASVASNRSKATTADARLRIVPPAGEAANASQSGVNAGGAGSELRAELSSAREDLAVKDAEINDLRGRVAELEKLRGNSTELLKLKDSELAALQQKLKELQDAQAAQVAAAALAAQKPAIAETVAVPSEDGAASAEPKDTTEVADKASEPVVAEAAAAQEPPVPVVDSKPAAQARPQPSVTPAPAPEEPSLLSNPMVLGGGALLAVGLLSWLLLGRGKGKSKPANKRGSDAGALAASIDAMRKAPEQDSDDADGEGDQVGEEGEVHDRLRELRASVAARPEQLEAHLAVLRYHYAHGEADDFEHAATDMLAHVVDPDGPQWKEACSLGRALCPGNGLFAAKIHDTDDHFHETAPEAEVVPVAMIDLHDADDDGDEFEKALAELDPSNQSHAPVDSVWQESDHNAAVRGADVDDDLGPIQYEESHGNDDAIATKLDLAQAYLDIGDGEAARALLDEVMSEGSESQKLRAQRLLSDIG